MAAIDTGEQDWREIMASKASKWNKRSRRLSHLTISTHSRKRSRSPLEMEDVEMGDTEMEADGEMWSETESTVSTGFSRSIRSRGTTLSGEFCPGLIVVFVASFLCCARGLYFLPHTQISIPTYTPTPLRTFSCLELPCIDFIL